MDIKLSFVADSEKYCQGGIHINVTKCLAIRLIQSKLYQILIHILLVIFEKMLFRLPEYHARVA